MVSRDCRYRSTRDCGRKIRYVLPRRTANTPKSKFGWNWFTPLLKIPITANTCIHSFIAFTVIWIGNSKLLQQIIDKVLTQGNLSSLNVLGTAMVVMALFQGVLQALRTFIFVDTTDRMDLTLGSAVIDRLLALPLSYFEKDQSETESKTWRTKYYSKLSSLCTYINTNNFATYIW